MASLQLRKRLAMFVALCQLILPLHTLPLQAQETAIQKSSDDKIRFDEADTGREGVATYYAKRYHGRRTLSGARYHPEKMTAASPDLPMGSKVTVKNLDNGKEVLVTVNDRCSKKKTPFIDLSRAAARKLGFLGRGIAKVMISAFKHKDRTENVAQGELE